MEVYLSPFSDMGKKSSNPKAYSSKLTELVLYIMVIMVIAIGNCHGNCHGNCRGNCYGNCDCVQ